ncbi:MAG: hypothetical protein ACXVFC_02510, partial [Gaiellaceae bacterium]
ELAAAQQDASRLAAREVEVADPSVLEDAELLTRLAELRSAIAGDVTANADDFAATHAALGRVFAAFHLCAVSELPGRFDAVVAVDGEEVLLERVPTVDGYVLEPEPRSDGVVLSGMGAIVPVPLGLTNVGGGANASAR